jgi:hypothetical protein
MQVHKVLRAISWVVLTTFTSLTMQPVSAALQLQRAKASQAPAPQSADEKYANALGDLEDQAKRARANKKNGKSSPKETQAIRSLEKTLDALVGDVEAGFAATEKHLNDKSLAQVIKDRHTQTVTTFHAKQAEFKALLQSLDDADDKNGDRDAALAALATYFDQFPQARRRAPLDPNNLPWRTPKGDVRPPITNAAGFTTAFFGAEKIHLAGPVPSGAVVKKSLPATPNADDLASTDDVQITQPIKDLAASLNNNPVQIYNWVRNNIRFVPTYGSIQGSQDTLDKLSGNAFDTSSLLIALYRAAGIPARYAYGTIEVPVDQTMNWVGGVTKAEAALSLLAQGGIPSAGLTSGGQITKFQLEHIWVEAYVDYYPSRGAINKNPNTWVPMDASFKQYSFTQGMVLQSNVPFDANSFLTNAQQGATINTAEGWVQNLNAPNVQAQITNYQTQLQNYINSQNPSPTVGDVLGTQTIVQDSPAILRGTPPYKIIAKGNKYATIPDSLRHQFKYSLYADIYSRNIDSPTWTFQQGLPKLAGKKVTLSFKPATQADADLIVSYLPQPHADGSPIQASEFPTQIPAYAKVFTELRVEGDVVASGGIFTLGTELAGRGGFTQYDFSDWDLTNDDTLVAGQASALGLSIQGISPGQFATLQTRLDQTQSKLQAQDLSGVTGDLIAGDILIAAVWGYLAALQSNGKLAERQAGVIDLPALSYGLFHAIAQPHKLYGIITTSIKFPGAMMDVGHLRHVRIAKDSSNQTLVNYNRMRGQFASAMEHVTPERFFVDPSTCNIVGTPNPDPSKAACPQAVSAVKALGLAESQGQKVYTITAANQQVINDLDLRSDTITDIQNAVAAGKEVTVHQSQITVNGWTGAGYSVVDPGTGAGAYLIVGGANGGFFFSFFLTVLCFIVAVFAFAEVSIFVGAVLLGWELLNFALWIKGIRAADNEKAFNLANAGQGLGAFLGLIPFGGVAVAGLVRWLGLAWIFELTNI